MPLYVPGPLVQQSFTETAAPSDNQPDQYISFVKGHGNACYFRAVKYHGLTLRPAQETPLVEQDG